MKNTELEQLINEKLNSAAILLIFLILHNE